MDHSTDTLWQKFKRAIGIDPVNRSARRLVGEGPVTEDHQDIDLKTGMQKGYVILSAEERAKGFVRPVRRSYRHLACGGVTTMHPSIAETLARDPGFYKGGFCAVCKKHYFNDEFVWEGTTEQVGT